MSGKVHEKQPPETRRSFVSNTPRMSGSSTVDDAPIDPTAERKLLLKLDLIIWPVFFIIYMMSFLDRINISNARIQGMSEDLDISQGSRFNIALFVRLPKPFKTK